MNKIKFKTLILLPILMMSILSCSDLNNKEEDDNGDNGGPTGNTVSTTLKLKILDDNNSPLSGVMVDIYGVTATTDGSGMINLDNVEVPEEDAGRMAVKLEKEGYFDNTLGIVPEINGTTYFEAMMLQRELAGTIENGSGGDISTSDGRVSVGIQSNSYVNVSGSGYSGPVNIYIRYVNPEGEDFGLQMPGGPDMSAEDPDGGEDGILKSFGAIYMEAEAENGDELRPLDAADFNYCIAIPASLQGEAPETIDIWRLGGGGSWEFVTTATKVGGEYCFNTSESGQINCDIFNRSAIVEGTVCDDSEIIAPFERIKIGQRFVYADENGEFSALVPANQNIIISTQFCAISIPELSPSTIYETSVGCDGNCMEGASGNPRFNLQFDSRVDFDLHVIDPNGEEIYYANEVSASGGTLDVDCQCLEGCSGSENIFWENGTGPNGTYQYWVHFYGACDDASSSFTLTVSRNGEIGETRTGTLSVEDEESTRWTYVH